MNAKSPSDKIENNELINKPGFVLKRVERNYVKKKQEEIMEENNKQKRAEVIKKNREANLPKQEEIKEELPPKIASIFEKYKKLEEEELKNQERKFQNNNKTNTGILFYDLKYEKNKNHILFNDQPTKSKYFLKDF